MGVISREEKSSWRNKRREETHEAGGEDRDSPGGIFVGIEGKMKEQEEYRE